MYNTEIPEASNAVLAIILTVGGYYSYYFTAWSEPVKTWFTKKYEISEIPLFLFRKGLGFIFLGVIPGALFLFLLDIEQVKYKIPVLSSYPWILFPLIFFLVIMTSYISARRPEVKSVIPQMRLAAWGTREIAASAAGWAIYLFAYEFILRGLLLFAFVSSYGITAAIIINVALYSAFHLPNGRSETIAAIPFGLILCFVSLSSGSFMTAFLLHYAFAVSTEMFSVHFNEQMRFTIKTETI
ncbi:MAG: CPBP family intramembrane metalloprotease [Bacteroidales bacterium]|jgi:membrane protease YdiL (CAAX protease family)|nr:CPBP family intramembrane metalloprotease [Bacteroidales bacterium]